MAVALMKMVYQETHVSVQKPFKQIRLTTRRLESFQVLRQTTGIEIWAGPYNSNHLRISKGQQSLNAALPRHVSQGLACVERIAMERGMVASGAYKGPLIDNFKLTNDAFRLAGELCDTTLPLLFIFMNVFLY